VDLEWIVKSACKELENKQGGALSNVSVREFFYCWHVYVASDKECRQSLVVT